MSALDPKLLEIFKLEKELNKLTGKVVRHSSSLVQPKIRVRKVEEVQLGINPYYQDCGYINIYKEAVGPLIIQTYSPGFIDDLEPSAFYKYTDPDISLVNIWVKPDEVLIGKYFYGRNCNISSNIYHLGDNKYSRAIAIYLWYKDILSLEECILHIRK